MDWLTFISKLIDSLVWPAVILLIVYWLKDAIAQRLKGLRKLKWGDKEAEFGDLLEVTKVVAEQSESLDEPSAEAKVEEEPHRFKRLRLAAERWPREAILEAWMHVEERANSVFDRLYPEKRNQMQYAHSVGNVMRHLLEEKLIDISVYTMFQNLKQMRNIAAHDIRWDVPVSEAQEYVTLARIVYTALDAIGRNPN